MDSSNVIQPPPECGSGDRKAMEQCYENLIVVDVGANLTNKKYQRDLDSVVQRAKDAGKWEATLCASGVLIRSEPRGTENYGNGYIGT